MSELTAHPRRHDLPRGCRFSFLLFTLLLLVASCSLEDDPVQERIRFAERSKEPIHIGIAWPFTMGGDDHFTEGMNMAVEEINQAGGILGRKLEIRLGDDKSSSYEGLVVAQEFAKDPHLLYVMGHCDTHVMLTTSLIYQVNSILFITPGTTSFRTTRRGFNMVFNNYHTEDEIILALTNHCHRQGYQRVALVFENTPYGSGLADFFENRADELGMDTIHRLPFDRPDVRVIRHMVKTLEDADPVDVVFIAGLMPEIGQVVALLRKWGMNLPIVGIDDLDTELYLEVAGPAAEGSVFPSAFDSGSPRPEVADFTKRFQAYCGMIPDVWAAQAYDSLKLLAFAAEKAQSAAPAKVAAALSRTRGWVGATGPHTFNEMGQVTGKPLVLKQVQNGQFVYLEDFLPEEPAQDKKE